MAHEGLVAKKIDFRLHLAFFLFRPFVVTNISARFDGLGVLHFPAR